MKIEERDMFEFKMKKSKQTIDDVLPVPPPFPSKPSVVAIIGAMGSGKSSLLKTLYGELKLQEGSIDIAGYDLQSIKPNE